MRTIWRFPLGGIPHEIEAPGLQRPVHVAPSYGTICVWAEVTDTAPVRRCVVTVHGTGHPIASDEHYIGSLHEDSQFVWHYYATEPS